MKRFQQEEMRNDADGVMHTRGYGEEQRMKMIVRRRRRRRKKKKKKRKLMMYRRGRKGQCLQAFFLLKWDRMCWLRFRRTESAHHGAVAESVALVAGEAEMERLELRRYYSYLPIPCLLTPAPASTENNNESTAQSEKIPQHASQCRGEQDQAKPRVDPGNEQRTRGYSC